jgi:predicted nucleotidyltransferase
MEVKSITILKQVKTMLEDSFKNEIKHIVLFGSRAEGKAKEYSDYDILIILKTDEYDWKFKYKIMELIYNIELENDIIIDIHILSDYELNNTLRGKQPIFEKALRTGVYA